MEVPLRSSAVRSDLDWREATTRRLSKEISAARLAHSINVTDQACALAIHWNVRVSQAMQAGLLHDCAKGMSLPQLHLAVLEGELRLNKAMWDSRALLHAPVGAYIAQRDYSIEDPEVLDAIRWHTTGRSHMSTLEKIIYLADVIEPDRAMFDELPTIRLIVWSDLDRAMLMALRSSTNYIEKHQNAVYVDTLSALHWFEAQCQA